MIQSSLLASDPQAPQATYLIQSCLFHFFNEAPCITWHVSNFIAYLSTFLYCFVCLTLLYAIYWCFHCETVRWLEVNVPVLGQSCGAKHIVFPQCQSHLSHRPDIWHLQTRSLIMLRHSGQLSSKYSGCKNTPDWLRWCLVLKDCKRILYHVLCTLSRYFNMGREERAQLRAL